jgi:hypothetical protein
MALVEAISESPRRVARFGRDVVAFNLVSNRSLKVVVYTPLVTVFALPVTEPDMTFETKRLVAVALPKCENEPKRFVDDAPVEKMFVVVALVKVTFPSEESPETVRELSVPTLVRDEVVTPAAKVLPVREDAATEPALPVTEPVIGFVAERFVTTAFVAKRFVDVAAVVVERDTIKSERPRSVARLGNEVVALRRISKSSPKVVVYTPFVTVPALPPIERVEVPIWVITFPGPPISRPPSETEARPVPPLATDSCPTHPGTKVCVSLSEVMLRVIFASVLVAKVWVTPDCHAPETPMAVMPEPPTPPASSPQPKRPFAQITLSEELLQSVVNPAPVKLPLMFIFVVDAFVAVISSVERFVAVTLEDVRVLKLAIAAKRFVLDAVDEKIFVEVALLMRSEPRFAAEAKRFVELAMVEKKFVDVALPRIESPDPLTMLATFATCAKAVELSLCLGPKVS